MAERRIKRRKPADKRKPNFLRVRVTDSLLDAMRKLADSKQISVSAWVTSKLVDAVRAEGGEV